MATMPIDLHQCDAIWFKPMIQKSHARQDAPSEKMVTRITVSLPADDHGNVCALAAKKKVSASSIVGDAIDR